MAKALQLGRYHLLDRIAFGGMAEIYRAKTFDDEGRVHMVAVKRILSHLARDEEFIKMLVDEAKIASLMEHEAIARVYEFCYAHGEYFIAMEYVDGKDGRTILDRCRAQRRWIPHEICAFIMMHIMRGLHEAHRQKDREGRPLHLIHRDVSPSNVICSYAGEVKLCDFGIAKATLSTVQTRSGVIKGKVKYMSPEQAMGRKLDPRTDIFSGGSVLYELLTRVPPFLAPNEMELLVLVRETRCTPVRERNPMIPPALEAIVESAMGRKPSDRYQTAEDFANALHNFLVVHAPDLTRSHLGRFVRQLFADDIEKELRALEEYVVDGADNTEIGENLIADALGPDADFSKFSPMPAEAETGDETQAPRDGEVEVEGEDAIGAAVHDPALSAEPTVILESSDLIQRLESTNPERLTLESEVLWKQGDDIDDVVSPRRSATERTQPLAPPPDLRQQRPPLDAGLHTANTVILDLGEHREALEDNQEALEDDQEVGDQPVATPGSRRRSVAADTAEMSPVAAPDAGPDPGLDPGLDPANLGIKSNSDTPLTAMSFHELPTGQLEDNGPGPSRGAEASPLSDDATAELEVSDLEVVVAPEIGAGPAPDTDADATPALKAAAALEAGSELKAAAELRAAADLKAGAVPVDAPALEPVIHTETTELLEVDDLTPEVQGVEDAPPDAPGSEG